MRILHLILSSGFAGTERATAEMCNAHASEHEVLLVVRAGHRKRGVSIRDFLSPEVRVVEVPRFWPGRAIARVIREFKPQVAHAHLRRATRYLAQLKPDCATISTLHMWVNGPHFLQMDGLIVIAAWQKKALATYSGRLFEINESLVSHRRLERTEIARLRQEWGVGEDDFLIGGVGRLAHSKGFDLLIQAFLSCNFPKARLVIVGEGREKTRLLRLAQGRVHFTGFRADVKDCYQAFDLFVSPSRSEPLGRVLLEALDAGTPVLASATEGATETLSRYPGRLVGLNDASALAQALQEYATHRPPRVALDLSPYYLSVVAQDTLAAYRQVIADHAARS